MSGKEDMFIQQAMSASQREMEKCQAARKEAQVMASCLAWQMGGKAFVPHDLFVATLMASHMTKLKRTIKRTREGDMVDFELTVPEPLQPSPVEREESGAGILERVLGTMEALEHALDGISMVPLPPAIKLTVDLRLKEIRRAVAKLRGLQGESKLLLPDPSSPPPPSGLIQ